MEKKLSPYQKLKKRVSELEKSLDLVCNEPSSPQAVGIKMAYKLKRQIENQLMMGNPTPQHIK